MKKVFKQLKSQQGQTMTEFMFVIVVLIAIVLLHSQLSLSYVTSSFLKYTSFMSARTEAVNPGSGQVYTEALIGTPQNNKLGALATVQSPPADSYVNQGNVTFNYSVLTMVPLVENLSEALRQRMTSSAIQTQPTNTLQGSTGVHFDNE